MKVCLYGPPGIGKSTATALLGWAFGVASTDLEDVFDPRLPSSFLQIMAADVVSALPEVAILGGAGFGPAELNGLGVMPLLLHMPQTAYDARRASRDASRPEKQRQTLREVPDEAPPNAVDASSLETIAKGVADSARDFEPRLRLCLDRLRSFEGALSDKTHPDHQEWYGGSAPPRPHLAIMDENPSPSSEKQPTLIDASAELWINDPLTQRVIMDVDPADFD